MDKEFVPNKLIECPEPGILFTRDNAAWAYHALKAVREGGKSIPEQDELCDELASILFPPAVIAKPEPSGPGLAYCRKDMNLRHPVGQCPYDEPASAPASPGPLTPGEDGRAELDDDEDGDPEAASLLPTGELMNPARPDTALFYDPDQVAYVVTMTGPLLAGAIRVLTSFGTLDGWDVGTVHRIRHDQTWYPLGSWRVTGIRHYGSGWRKGDVPDRPLHHCPGRKTGPTSSTTCPGGTSTRPARNGPARICAGT